MQERLPRLKQKVSNLPTGPGVYLMKDRLGQVIYIGKAKNLKKRVSSYFQRKDRRFQGHSPKIGAMVELVHDIEILTVKSEAEALLLEGRLLKEWKPKYNTDFKDDKQFLLVRVDFYQAIPQFRFVRSKSDPRAQYYGPFVNSNLVRQTLQEMRRQFGVLLGDTNPKQLEDGRYQLYDDMRAEIYGHANIVQSDEYKSRVLKACAFFEGKAREWVDKLKEEMQEAAANQRFERAAYLRDLMQGLRKSLAPERSFMRTDVISKKSYEAALPSLQSALGMPTLPRIIECFDISHVSGTFVVASMVQFKDGRPNKANYRHFRIRSFEGNDDFRSMEEVVGRRYQRLQSENKPFPDLIVIDGGKGQVSAALRAFAEANIDPPFLIGLAKKEETIILSDGRPPINLPENSGALQLLQRARDEAHRFANSFNAELRARKIRESILDELPGVGPVMKSKLMRHFKTIEAIRAASTQDFLQVAGVGKKRAEEWAAFFGASEA